MAFPGTVVISSVPSKPPFPSTSWGSLHQQTCLPSHWHLINLPSSLKNFVTDPANSVLPSAATPLTVASLIRLQLTAVWLLPSLFRVGGGGGGACCKARSHSAAFATVLLLLRPPLWFASGYPSRWFCASIPHYFFLVSFKDLFFSTCTSRLVYLRTNPWLFPVFTPGGLISSTLTPSMCC